MPKKQTIERRDFLQGTALALGALTAAGPAGAQTLAQAASAYPPALTGLRGSTTGSFEAAHALRDGQVSGQAQDSGEAYDLVVVGAGMSGLAAAHFHLERAGASARVLVLDNHDDFGGHARRNEFGSGPHLRLAPGGTLMIESPQPYSELAAGLLARLGIDLPALVRAQAEEDSPDAQLGQGLFFDRETFGADHLAVGKDDWGWMENLAAAPLSARARADLLALRRGNFDPLAGLSGEQKKDRLSRLSYRDYLLELRRSDPQVAQVLASLTHNWWGVGIDAVSALDVWGVGLDPMRGLDLPPGATERMGYTPAGYARSGGSLRLRLPDGNASLARLLVERLAPHSVNAAPAGKGEAGAPAGGRSLERMVRAQIDYGALDRPGTAARIRLESTAVRVAHVDPAVPAQGVSVDYLRHGRLERVQARAVVLACNNAVIPYLCPSLPPGQKAALHEAVRAPFLYTQVAVRDARPWYRLGVAAIDAPGGYHCTARLAPRIDWAAYRSPRGAAAPTVLHLVRTPCLPGLPEHEQNRAGRAELLATPFEAIEHQIRDQLGRMLGAGGFDAQRDIQAITVNRWSHGYAHEFNPLFEPVMAESERAHVRGRAVHGRIAIANSDSGGGAYTDVAIDQAWRALQDLQAAGTGFA
jgi:spermidine dehydrogenase